MKHARHLTIRRPLDDAAACDSARCDTTQPDATRPDLGLTVDSQETLDGGSYDLDPQEMPGGLESRSDLQQENLATAAAAAAALPPTATAPPWLVLVERRVGGRLHRRSTPCALGSCLQPKQTVVRLCLAVGR